MLVFDRWLAWFVVFFSASFLMSKLWCVAFLVEGLINLVQEVGQLI